MRDFKFFKGDLKMIDDDVRATASFNADTPEGHYARRRLYHTDRNLYHRLNNPFNNNEMERYYYDHGLGRFETVRPTLNQEEVVRRINGSSSVTTVNPKWWMKINMLFQKLKTNAVINTNGEVIGIFAIATTVTIIFGLMIAKVLNIW
jgi:hypothetical protein